VCAGAGGRTEWRTDWVRKERESSAGEAEEAGGGGDDGAEVGRIFSYICFCLGGLVVFVP
jgi:hypothetical protein